MSSTLGTLTLRITNPKAQVVALAIAVALTLVASLIVGRADVDVLSAVEVSDSVAAEVAYDVTVHPQAGWVDDDGALRSRADRTSLITFNQQVPYTEGTQFILSMRARHKNGPAALYRIEPDWTPETVELEKLNFTATAPLGLSAVKKDVWVEVDVTDWMSESQPLSVVVGSEANAWFYSAETVGSEPVIIARNGTPLEVDAPSTNGDSDSDSSEQATADDPAVPVATTLVRPPTTGGDASTGLRMASPEDGTIFDEPGQMLIEAIGAEASDIQVEFFIDGVFVGAEESAPFTYSWNFDGDDNGSHQVWAEYTDGADRIVATPHTVRIEIAETATTVPESTPGTQGGSDAAPTPSTGPTGAKITAATETEPVKNGGDAADDPAIWVDRSNPERSTILGTDKLGGIGVYDLSGTELHFYDVGRVNNIDLRQDVQLGGRTVALVAGSERDSDEIIFFTVDPATRGLVRAGSVQSGLGVAGLCMYRAVDGTISVFVSDSSGSVEHWEIDTSRSTVSGRRARTLRVGSTTEGCVADDQNGSLFISEEDRGIWRYPADANDETDRVLVDSTTSNGGRHLRADIEGLAIWEGGDGEGYLVASSQANDSFVVYARSAPHDYVATFTVDAGALDGVDYTDGIDVTSANLGSRYPNGIFVAQDNTNGRENQNFKIVDWNMIAGSVLGSKGSTSTTTAAPTTTATSPVAPTTASTTVTSTTAAPTTASTSQSQGVTASTFYVRPGGDDSLSGVGPATAWRTLSHASSQLRPGDNLLLEGGTWSESLNITNSGTAAQPITVGSFGETPAQISGSSTCVRLGGDHLVIEGLIIDGCAWSGITVEGDHNAISSNLITNNVTGIYVKDSADGTRIIGNELLDNNLMSVNDPGGRGDSGAFGILLHGSNTDVGYNTISGSDAFSFDYGRDGAAIEIFGAVNSHIHHNRAHDNDTFAELGEPGSSGNRFDNNVVTSTLETSVFLVTRGDETRRGPVTGTIVEHNSVLLTGSQSQGFVCHAGCARSILTLRNNVIEAGAKVGYADGPFVTGGNVFHGGDQQFSPETSDRTSDPLWADRSTFDLRLAPASPASGFGLDLGYQSDYAGAPIPAVDPDSGALQN